MRAHAARVTQPIAPNSRRPVPRNWRAIAVHGAIGVEDVRVGKRGLRCGLKSTEQEEEQKQEAEQKQEGFFLVFFS